MLFLSLSWWWCAWSLWTIPDARAELSTKSSSSSEKWYNGKHVYDAPVSVETDYGDENDHPLRRAARRFEREQERRKLFWPISTDPSNKDGKLSDDYVRETLMDEARFRPLRITFQTADSLDEFAKDQRYREVVPFVVNALQATSDRWAQTLSVFPAQRLVLDKDCPCNVVRDSRHDLVVENSDLHVFVQAETDETSSVCAPDEMGPGALAFASACQMDQFYRPTGGNVFMCLNTISEFLFERGRGEALESLLDHELGHVLGFTSFFLPFFWDRTTGQPRTPNARDKDFTRVECVRDNFATDNSFSLRMRLPDSNTLQSGRNRQGALFYEVVTPTVQTVVRNQFGCPSLNGARLENQPTSLACFGNHWDNRMFHSEFMNPYLGTTDTFVSPLTLAYFEDSGWYLANYSVAHISPYGHGRGCDFAGSDCILEGGVIPDYGRGVFCAQANETGCGPSHRAIVKCNITDYDGIPDGYSWFPEKNAGGRERHEYCPMYEIPDFTEGDLTFERDCGRPLMEGASSEPLERYGLETSRCFERSPPVSQFVSATARTERLRPLCLETNCNAEENVVEILVGNDVFVCQEDGQRIAVSDGVNSQEVFCPPLAEICPDLICRANCAGRGICAFARKNPECVCYDPSDPSPYCVNSPIFPTADFVFQDECQDDTNGTFTFIRSLKNKKEKKCKWLPKGGDERVELHCRTLMVAADLCRKTCGSRIDGIREILDGDDENAEEEDDSDGSFPAFRRVERNCEWLSQKEARRSEFCGPENVAISKMCPQACGLCKE